MVKAVWNDVVIAESNDTVMVEGNHYFPLEAVDAAALKSSSRTSVCPWKGTATYYTVSAGGADSQDAAWTYAEPKSAAAAIKGRIAFWKGVTVS